jgi:hypothetical protein
MREVYDTDPVSVVPHRSSTIDREAADLKIWNRMDSLRQRLGRSPGTGPKRRTVRNAIRYRA